jgi:Homeodomain-like domain-containing protein
MKAELLTMSAKEVNRLGVVQRVVERRLAQVEAATILSLTTRQVRRLVKRYFKNGPAGLLRKTIKLRVLTAHKRLPLGIDWYFHHVSF